MSGPFPGDGQLVLRLKVVVREDVEVGRQGLPGEVFACEIQALRGHLARAEVVVAT